MAIEVRQLVIKSQVTATAPSPQREAVGQRELDRVKAQILAECKALLRQRLQESKER